MLNSCLEKKFFVYAYKNRFLEICSLSNFFQAYCTLNRSNTVLACDLPMCYGVRSNLVTGFNVTPMWLGSSWPPCDWVHRDPHVTGFIVTFLPHVLWCQIKSCDWVHLDPHVTGFIVTPMWLGSSWHFSPMRYGVRSNLADKHHLYFHGKETSRNSVI